MTERFFRPSLVIFVDKVGEEIYEQLSSILRLIGLAEPLRKCIGLIHYTHTLADTPIVISQLASDIFDTEMQDIKGTLKDAKLASRGTITASDLPTLTGVVEHLRRSISMYLDTQSDEITRAGYSIPRPSNQIYIIGSANSALMHNVLRIVREWSYPNDRTKESDVYLLLHSSISVSSTTITDTTDIVQQAISLVRFSYLFEDMPAGYISEKVSHYVIAQALYALITTGITSQDLFEKSIDRQLAFNENKRVGYLITSCIIFPRKLLRDYCSAYLGSELMQQWSDDSSAGLTLVEKATQERRVQQLVEEVKLWIRDSLQRPEEFFALFSPESVDEEYKNCKAPADTWVDIVDRITVKKAQERYEGWKQEITDLWKRSKNSIHAQIKKTVRDISSSKVNSSNLIKTYISECQERLTSLFSEWSNHREDRYQSAIKNFEGTLSASSKEINHQPYTSGNQFSVEAEHIVELLRQRFASEQARVPSVLTLAAVTVLVVPPLALIVSALFPKWSVLPVIGAVVGFIFLWNILYRRWQLRNVKKIRKALLRLCHLYFQYAFDCEGYLYQNVIDFLYKSFNQIVQDEDRRFREISTVTAKVKAALQADIDILLTDLFDSPQAARDIFIEGVDHQERGDRKRIDLSYVKNLAINIAQQQGGKPKQNYNRSQFFKSFHVRLKQIIEMDGHEAQQHVLSIVQNMIDTSLNSYSLTKMTKLTDQIWEEAFSLVHSPLSDNNLGSPNLLFICGGNQALLENGKTYVQKSMQQEPIIVHTDNSECLLLAGFFCSSSAVPHETAS